MKSRYRLADLLLAPSLLSLLRIPLAVCFVVWIDEPGLALLILALAGLSDVLDGFVARRYGQVTATGIVLDPITDKLFVLVVATALVVTRHLSLGASLLLGTRELGEAPLVCWFAWSPAARAARAEPPAANALGKLATALQFAAVAWALFRWRGLAVWLALSGVAGLLAAVSYWRRLLKKADVPG